MANAEAAFIRNKQQLANKVAIITGASSGIGRAAAKVFAAEGAKLIVTARRRERLESLAAEIQEAGGIAMAVPGDVCDSRHLANLVDVAEGEFGGLDIAFNNAGTIGAMKPFLDIGPDNWAHSLATNLSSAFHAAQFQIPAMLKRGGGSLLFTSSFVGYSAAFAGMADYAASKAGLIGLVKALAVEYGGAGIRVNALLPGGTDTEMNIANAPGASPEVMDYVKGIHALKRLARPEEIARAALFLASDEASFMTGASVLVDGGVSIFKG